MRLNNMTRAAACVLPFLPALTGAGYLPAAAETAVPAPVFSQESGFYKDAFDLKLTAPEGCTVCYTLDGSDPTAESAHYENPIPVYDRTPEENVYAKLADAYSAPAAPVDKAMIVRAAAYDAAGGISETVTKTYFIGYEQSDYLQNMPVISLVTDPDNLFDPKTGIYVEGDPDIPGKYGFGNYMQKGMEWERPAQFTLFEQGKAVYSANTGIRIHGYSSSALPQKSFKLYSRAEYGTKKFDYDFFHGAVKNVNGEHIGSFNHLILRNGGNDQKLKLRDRLNQEMAAGGSFGTQAQTECIVFLDGEYWGLYNITEKLNESYVTAHYGVKKSTVCMFKDPVEYIEGDVKGLEDYKELLALAVSDLSDADAYDRAAAVLDTKNFAKYMAAEIIIANHDINDNNFALWKTDTVDSSNPYADGRWRFLLYDTECGQGLTDFYSAEKNMISWMLDTNAWNFRLLFSLLESSPKFRGEFAQAYFSLCRENFSAERVLNRLDTLYTVYQEALAETYDRFYARDGDADSVLDKDLSSLQFFWTERAEYARKHLLSHLQAIIRAGDVNGDTMTDAADARLLCGWLSGKPDAVPAEPAAGDLNGDGRLDAADLTLLKRLN